MVWSPWYSRVKNSGSVWGSVSWLQGQTISRGGYSEDTLRSTYTPTVTQLVTVLQSRLLELYGAPLIYKGPDLLESTSVYELRSGSLGTQLALLPTQDPGRAVTVGTSPCRPLCLRSLWMMLSTEGRGRRGLKALTELNPRNTEQIRRRQIRELANQLLLVVRTPLRLCSNIPAIDR